MARSFFYGASAVRFLKWLSAAALGILLLIILLLALLLSPWGTRLGLSLANNMFDELDIDYKSGGLASQIQLSTLRWQQTDASVVVHDISLELDLSCWWGISVCVEQLSTGTIDVNIKPAAKQQEPDPAQNSDKITLPINVNVVALKLGRLNLLVEDQVQVSWQSLESRLQFYQTLEIEQLSVSTLDISLLAQTDKNQTTPQQFDWANWQYQPLSAVDIQLPISLDLQHLDIAPLTVSMNGELPHVFESVVLAATVEPEKIELSQLLIKHKSAELSATAKLWLDDVLTHELSVNTTVNEQQLGKLDTAISSQGDINKLKAELHSSGLINADVVVETQLSSAKLPVNITLDWQHLEWPLDGPKTDKVLQSPQGQFSLAGDLDGLQIAGQTEVSGASIPQTSIELDATASRKGLDLKSLLAKTLGGQAIIKGSVKIEDSVKMLANMRLEHINPGVFDPAYHGDVSGQLDVVLANTGGEWQGALQNLDMHGTWRSFPLKAQGKVDFDGKANINVETLHIENGDNSLTMNGQLGSDKSLDFNLEINAPKLQQSIADVQGGITANAQVSGSIEQPQLSYKLAGQQLAFADITIKNMQGSGEVIWNDVKPLNIELELQQIVGINNQIDEAKLVLNGNAANHQLVLDTTSNKTNLQAKITGSLFEN